MISKNYSLQTCLLNIFIHDEIKKFIYFLKIDNDKWGVSELDKIIGSKKLSDMFDLKPKKIISTNLIYEN